VGSVLGSRPTTNQSFFFHQPANARLARAHPHAPSDALNDQRSAFAKGLLSINSPRRFNSTKLAKLPVAHNRALIRNVSWDEEVISMLRTASKTVLMLILSATLVAVTSRAAYPQTGSEQRAYQAGFQNGQNDRSRNKPMNLKTDNWQGQNLTAYQRGYADGYRGRGNGPIGARTGYTTDAERRAYQAGFQNGQNDRGRNKPMNLKTDNWQGQNLTAYQRGYADGYRH
jgi:hypothetical protein